MTIIQCFIFVLVIIFGVYVVELLVKWFARKIENRFFPHWNQEDNIL